MTDSVVPPEAFLDFTVRDFRCFRESTRFPATKKVSVLAGENNSGKSTLLLPLRRLTTVANPVAVPYHGSGMWGGDTIDDLRFELGDFANGSETLSIEFHDQRLGSARTLTGKRSRTKGIGTFSIRLESQNATFNSALEHAAKNIVFIPPRRHLRSFLHEDDLPAKTESVFDGATVLPNVLSWSNPGNENKDDTLTGSSQLHAVEQKLTELLDAPVRLRPLPHYRDVEVEINGQSVALSRLGAGIEQAMILAFALVQFPDQVLLVEEPENFLHPTVQRRLLAQFLERTAPSIVTTHSNHLLDVRHPDIGYFRTYRKQNRSHGIEAMQANRRYELLRDLGVRPSSLFESNALLWVEGPSDAIYLRRWLSLHPEGRTLVEGVDFSFAYHAGSLLKSFYRDWEGDTQRTTGDQVDMCSVHPNFYLVADRDATNDDVGHDYLRSVLQDARAAGITWVTKGKEVENYIPVDLLCKYLEEAANPHREVTCRPKQEDVQYQPVWQILNTIAGLDHRKGYPDKVDFALWVTRHMSEEHLDTLDLRKSLQSLVDFVKGSRRGILHTS